jgi:hypothetical protein
LSEHSPRSTLDTFQRLFYAARESANAAEGITIGFVATMNGDTLKELGREVAMGGVVAHLTLPSACKTPQRRPMVRPESSYGMWSLSWTAAWATLR